MFKHHKLLLGLVAVASCAFSFAGQFYLFPVKEVEGLASANSTVARPLIDPKFVLRFLSGDAGQSAQQLLLGSFSSELDKTYPNSVIHPRQVYDTKIPGAYKFNNNDGQNCKSSPSYSVVDSYAVILGVTRASIYEVEKGGGNIEVLIPITLNLQFVKPNLAKIVFTTSETVYSPFRFSKDEYKNGAKDALIRDILVKNINTQIASLLETAKKGFNPQEVPIKIVDKDGKFFVTDKGFEAGFIKGDQVEARASNDEMSIFDVVYADSGYAVLSLAAGKASVGDSFKFVFEKPADDSRKPKLMPVVSETSPAVNAISDLFSKDIGFKATFQLSPVDVNFTQTKELITRSANCVDWKKIPSMTEVGGDRKDPPDFFLKFTSAQSPTALLSGSGGTKTSERFHTLVTTQVVDHHGKVVYSEIGDDDYSLDKVNNQGLNLEQAKEISLKNATQKMAKNVISSVKFLPKDFKVTKVDKDRVWVEALSGVSNADKPTFGVIHPLTAKVNGKPTFIDLDVGEGTADLLVDGGLVGLPYSQVNPALPAPSRGDLVRIYSPITPITTPIAECIAPTYVGQGNVVDAPYFDPLIKHAIYRSGKFMSYINDDSFYSETNKLLSLGMFGTVINKKNQELCFVPGYVIREASSQCDDPSSCKATLTTGALVRLMKGAELAKTISTGIQSEISGFQSATKKDFYGYKQLSNGIPLTTDLTNKLNLN